MNREQIEAWPGQNGEKAVQKRLEKQQKLKEKSDTIDKEKAMDIDKPVMKQL